MAVTEVGHFMDRASADAAYSELMQSGFSPDDVSVVGRRDEAVPPRQPEQTVTTGGAATVGIIEGLLLGAVLMLIPGLGPVVAVGPVAAALSGIVTGGITGLVVGGIAGALIHSGVDEERARYFEQRLREGGTLITVRTDDVRGEEARRILERHGADVHAAGARG